MRRAIRKTLALAVDVFGPKGPVVELGACYQPGYEALSDLRPLFPDREYMGCDIRYGLGVDRLEDAEALTFENGSVGTMVLCEILEHLPRPERAVAEARRVLRPDGILLVSVPFHYRLHGFPSDYWRFTSAGVHQLLKPFGGRTVCAIGPRLKPAFIFAVATPELSTEFVEASERFASAVMAAFRTTRLRGLVSVLKERGRDFFGVLLGRGELGVEFFDPARPGGYRREL